MRQMLLLLGMVLAVIGSGGIAVARQSEESNETKRLLILQAVPEDGAAVDPELLDDAARTIALRVKALGIEGAEVWTSGGNQIVVELPGINGDEADRIAQRLTAAAQLEVIDPQGEFLAAGTIVVTTLGGPTDGATPATETVYTTVISGADVQEADKTTNQFGGATVTFTLTDQAAERFYEYTSRHIGQPLSIVLNKRVVSSPIVNSAIRDQGIIEGLTEEEVDDLVLQLDSGAMALPLRVVTTMVLTGVPEATPTPVMPVPTPVSGRPVTATACWTNEQRKETDPPQWSAPPAMVVDPAKQYTATMETSLGEFTLTLFPQDAPITVNNFVCLARAGYFDHTLFHRVLAGFVIQGGDPTGTGRGWPGYRFDDEPITRDYELGTLAMANSGADTNGSQFFIVVGENGTQLPKNYTIFGQVSAGMEVVEQIANVPTRAGSSGEKSIPIKPVWLERVTIHES